MTRLTVHIITDASVDLERKSGAWAGWARSPRGEMNVVAGRLKQQIGDSNTAELLAVANTLHLAFRRGIAQPGDKICLGLDNLNVKGWLGKMVQSGTYVEPKRIARLKHPDEIRAAAKMLRELLQQQRCQMTVHHIKAHSGQDTVEKAIHHLCDKAAKAARVGKMAA